MEKIKPRSQTASAVVLAFSARGHVNKVEPTFKLLHSIVLAYHASDYLCECNMFAQEKSM